MARLIPYGALQENQVEADFMRPGFAITNFLCENGIIGLLYLRKGISLFITMGKPDDLDRHQQKRLRFSPALVPLVTSGKKTSTWRVGDEKDITRGDILQLLTSAANEHRPSGVEDEKPFAIAKVVDVTVKTFRALVEKDLTGHERFKSRDEMVETYRRYYPDANVSLDTPIKLIRFQLEDGGSTEA